MNSIRAFLAEIIDYAGLFPPASLPMGAVVSNYAEYLSGPDSDLLGRLVVPAARLTEFAEAARDFLPRRNGSAPWRLSVLVGDQTEADARSILEFNSTHLEGSHSGLAVCDSVEMHARQAGDVARAAAYLPGSFRMFFEIEPDGGHAPLIREVALQKTAAKIRTGGVTEAAFPASARVVQFIAECHRASVPFKATAGLHHLIRSHYPLTYEPQSPCATMFGYLNLFFSAAFIRKGMHEDEARMLLEEQSPGAFDITDDGASWRGHVLSNTDMQETRAHFALSFGSCSFREPVDEARALRLI